MKRFSTSSFWGFISDFYQLLNERTRDKFEYFWEGLSTITAEMTRAASRFIVTTDPEQSPTSPSLNIYGIEISIVSSKPLPIDSTDPNSRSIFIPKHVIANPTSDGRRDRIEVEKYVYDAFVDIGAAVYSIINDGLTARYFKIAGFVESGGYFIELYADLSYLNTNRKIQVSLTSGRAYAVDPYIIDLPWLRTTVMDGGITFRKDIDFVYGDGVVELLRDLIEDDVIEDGDSLYCENVPVMEFNLFNSYGSGVGITDWRGYGFDGVGARTSISAMMMAVQNPANVVDFEKGISVLAGLPLAPEAGVVIGVYESHDYEVVEISGNIITFAITETGDLHNFIQVGTKMVVDGGIDEVDVAVVTDRSTWTIELVDAAAVSVGDRLNVRLIQRIPLASVVKASGQCSVFDVTYPTALGEFQHVIDKYEEAASTYNLNRPVFFIGDNVNYFGLYHAVLANASGFKVADVWDDAVVPQYNDFVVDADVLSLAVTDGYIHWPWPTHKYVLLRFQDGTLYKAYIDSKIDTILEGGDAVAKYQPLTRCLRVCDHRQLPMWNEYDGFNKNNGIDPDLNGLELMWTIPGAKTGIHFPN